MENTNRMDEKITTADENLDSGKGKNDKKIIIFVIALLLVLTVAATWLYLSKRSEIPENSLVLVSGGKEQALDIFDMTLTSFSGSVVNGKGDKKDIEGQGIKLADVIGTSDFSEVAVTADDEFSATVKKEEIDQAWLQIEEGEAGLVVFGDKDSKRRVKHVVRIEVK